MTLLSILKDSEKINDIKFIQISLKLKMFFFIYLTQIFIKNELYWIN